jgi:cytoskeletal protein CcmA (bactofilin family)
MSQLLVDDIVNKDDTGSPEFSKGVRVTGVGTFSSDLEVAGNLNVTGDITYDEVSGRNLSISGITTVNTFGATGISTVGILTAYDSITVKVGSGSTELAGAIKTNTTNISTNTTNIATKASTGKAIAMAMVFG